MLERTSTQKYLFGADILELHEKGFDVILYITFWRTFFWVRRNQLEGIILRRINDGLTKVRCHGGCQNIYRHKGTFIIKDVVVIRGGVYIGGGGHRETTGIKIGNDGACKLSIDGRETGTNTVEGTGEGCGTGVFCRTETGDGAGKGCCESERGNIVGKTDAGDRGGEFRGVDKTGYVGIEPCNSGSELGCTNVTVS